MECIATWWFVSCLKFAYIKERSNQTQRVIETFNCQVLDHHNVQNNQSTTAFSATVGTDRLFIAKVLCYTVLPLYRNTTGT